VGTRRIGQARRGALVGLAVAMAAATVACGSSDDGGAGSGEGGGGGAAGSGSSRGFDGETITVAGIGSAALFADADVGAQARFQRANETDELDGIEIEYAGFADDRQDPATATSEVRRLVTQERVFAIVPDLSALNPGDYLAEQHVPYVGTGYDDTYCTQEPDDSVWGFGFNGCLVPADPPVMPDTYHSVYEYVTERTGDDEPSIALFTQDNESGQNSARFGRVGAEGAGFDVVYAEAAVPPATSDYTPYVQQWLTSDGGEPPDVLTCLLTVECIDIWTAVRAAGYEGTFQTPLFSELLVGPLEGTVALAGYNTEPNDGLTQMQEDLEAFEPGTQVSTTNAYAYFTADMFIQAVKEAAPDITPESVQEALADQEWEIDGLAGPLRYPESTVASTPFCSTLLESDGTQWDVVVPYSCSDTTYPVED
jgi:ABC-type branched-subunit amino acid transport system substrate-binding protein